MLKMNKILGKKVGMTQLFLNEGKAVSVTVIKSGNMKVTQVKSNEKEGYNAIQFGLVEEGKKIKHKRPILNHLKKADAVDTKFIKESRIDDIGSYKIGDVIELNSLLSEGDFVNVTGNTIGRGFTGTTKRFGFHGGRKTHGSRFHKAPGSIGMCRPTRTVKGRKMPGHYGNEQVTIKNLKILKIDKDKNLILIMGGVPGPKNGNLIIQKVIS
jgi:large subunit ribosomal protein L3